MRTKFTWRPAASGSGSFVKIDLGTGEVMKDRSGQPVTANEFALAPSDLPDHLAADHERLKRQWGIAEHLPGVEGANLLGILQDMSRVRTMSQDERNELVARTFQLERLDRDNIALAQTLRNRMSSALQEPWRWVPVMTDEELVHHRKLSAEVAGLSEQGTDLFRDMGLGSSSLALLKKHPAIFGPLGLLSGWASYLAEKNDDHYSDRMMKYSRELERRLEAAQEAKEN